MVQALNSKEIDYAYDLPPTLAGSLEGDENIAIVNEAADYHTNLAFNFGGQDEWHPIQYGTPPTTEPTNHPALHDHDVRLAIAHAIDKQALADVVFQGAALPADTFIAPDKAFWHLDIPAEDEYAFDLDEANRILDEAGYTERTDDGVRIDPESGEPLVLDIVAINNSRGSARSGELMAGWMEEIGIRFDLRVVSETKGYEEWENGTFDAYIWSWGGDPDPDFNMSIYTTDSCLAWSDGCWSDPAVRRALRGAAADVRPGGPPGAGATSSSGCTTRRSLRSTSCIRSCSTRTGPTRSRGTSTAPRWAELRSSRGGSTRT